ncbi:MAG: YdiU family protein [Gammaproteobacteria bacterium]|nr:YdiU family protein [Gammaproteobacteria bacterium]
MLNFGFDNSYRRLPAHFHARLSPIPVEDPRLVAINRPLADSLGLDVATMESALAAVFSGNQLPADAEPIALAYAGHQFGQFVPQLGDGRAILLGEVIDREGRRRDIQLKGSGRTPFSRNGDGRAALGPVLREFLLSEAMHALGIPTTRALAAVTTGELVYRDHALPGAIFTRVAASHIRVGTFQFFAARGHTEALRQLADHVIARHYPDVRNAERPYLALLEQILDRQSFLVARWLHVGFIHGVMNTDNMAVSGETIDYGPCAFMDQYDPATVFSSIDYMGRYAFANQPRIAQWNLARLAETLLPLIDADPEQAIAPATEVIEAFPDRFERHWLEGMRRKLGLQSAEPDDGDLIQELLDAMHRGSADYTLTFRGLCAAAADVQAKDTVRRLFANSKAFDDWIVRWRNRLTRDPQSEIERTSRMRQVNPAFIPRNHRVEEALSAAVERGDFQPFERLRQILEHPYDEQPAFAAYAEPPPPSDRVYQTFCGT